MAKTEIDRTQCGYRHWGIARDGYPALQLQICSGSTNCSSLQGQHTVAVVQVDRFYGGQLHIIPVGDRERRNSDVRLEACLILKRTSQCAVNLGLTRQIRGSRRDIQGNQWLQGNSRRIKRKVRIIGSRQVDAPCPANDRL